VTDCNELKTEKRHKCANMENVKWLKLWWQLSRTSLPEQDVRNIRPMDFCFFWVYKEKKMAPGFTVAKEQTTVVFLLAMLKKKFLHETSCYLPAENLYHWRYSSNFFFLCMEGLSRSHGYQAKCSLMWLKTEIQHEPKSCCTTENIDSKILVMLDKWYHFSSQCKSVLIATFKAFYVWMSFAICMQVPDGKNKFIVKEFFKSVNIKHVLEYHGWNMVSNFSILQHWILKKKLWCHFIQDFQFSE